jgi:hypothetical protein
MRMFSGLRSRCTKPFKCRCPTPSILSASSSGVRASVKSVQWRFPHFSTSAHKTSEHSMLLTSSLSEINSSMGLFLSLSLVFY